ncbi:hypothetical protein COB64_01415 [Candidatus Wolfebacteria bacterium]|nr:MAG: hypothetical protein COB64_01415 [Candidatus Wolfebacteria bacterium]
MKLLSYILLYLGLGVLILIWIMYFCIIYRILNGGDLVFEVIAQLPPIFYCGLSTALLVGSIASRYLHEKGD